MNSLDLTAVANHVWQSTLFAMAVGCLTVLLRKNSARLRYSLWLVASVKFLIPFAWLTAVGAAIPWADGRAAQNAEPTFLAVAGKWVAPYGEETVKGGGQPEGLAAGTVSGAGQGDSRTIALTTLWALGTTGVLVYWLKRWQVVRRAVRSSTQANISFIAPVRLSASQLEPVVVGILRPVLLLPQGLEERLTPEEMRAVLDHERCHVAWRDNLAASVHMVVEAVFWFHPLVWWLGSRLIHERERACDEHVLADGNSPENYGEGILKVCEHYLESRLVCAAGIGGANLKQRIECIMQNSPVETLSRVRKLTLALMAGATLTVPVAVGIFASPHANAQTAATADLAVLGHATVQLAQPDRLVWDPSRLMGFTKIPDGPLRRGMGLEILNDTAGFPFISMRRFIADAYGMTESQVTGRDLRQEPHYDITFANARAARTYFEASQSGAPQLIDPSAVARTLLQKRFGLVVRHERKPMTVYVLTTIPGGSKLRPYAGSDDKVAMYMGVEDGVDASGFPLSSLAAFLEATLTAPVEDKTGLRGYFEYKAKWTWKAGSPGGMSYAAVAAKALEEQLGLHLEAKTETLEVIDVVSLKSQAEVLTGQVEEGAGPVDSRRTSL